MNAVLFRKGRIGLAVTLAAGLCASGGFAETELPYATGGEVTKIDLGNLRTCYIHVFTNTDAAATFKNTGLKDLSLRYLVVGAGGSGGNAGASSQYAYSGGGGGGGGVCEKKDVPFAANAAWTVLVGAGAKKVVSTSDLGTVAGASSISNGTEEVVLVPGGGNGGRGSTGANTAVPATDGAAGGGASGPGAESRAPGAGTYVSFIFGVSPAGAPFSGGPSDVAYLGTGGGGASETGGVSVAKTSKVDGKAGNGGEGLASDITGEKLVYGSGGGAGGHSYSSRAVGGKGGTRAGNGGTFEILDGEVTNPQAATAPAANSGGGGGGGGAVASGYYAATDGADGIVVIRYEVTESPCEGGDVVKRIHVRGTRYSYIHIFTNTAAAAEFKNLMDCELKLRYLVVGAGGGGSNGSGGGASGAGGGGGGVLEVRGYRFASGAQFSVEVGKGALPVKSGDGSEAGSSYVRAGETVIASAMGGGNAGFYSSITAANCKPPTGGANGGGGARSNEEGAMGLFESSINGVKYGPFKGGDYSGNGPRVGGSGAGAGANGGKATSKSTVAPTGGEGLASDITGEMLVYGSGGGVGESLFQSFPGLQGSDGGTRAGNGTKQDFTFTENDDGTITTNFNYIAATVPVANSGGGGGGGGITGAGSLHPSSSLDKFRNGTGGADGIVVFRYDYDPNPPRGAVYMIW